MDAGAWPQTGSNWLVLVQSRPDASAQTFWLRHCSTDPPLPWGCSWTAAHRARELGFAVWNRPQNPYRGRDGEGSKGKWTGKESRQGRDQTLRNPHCLNNWTAEKPLRVANCNIPPSSWGMCHFHPELGSQALTPTPSQQATASQSNPIPPPPPRR